MCQLKVPSLAAAPSLPQALLFDEEYESHSFYQYRKARRWLSSAKAIVFVGTSFAVGITEQALHVAEEGVLPVSAESACAHGTIPRQHWPAESQD